MEEFNDVAPKVMFYGIHTVYGHCIHDPPSRLISKPLAPYSRYPRSLTPSRPFTTFGPQDAPLSRPSCCGHVHTGPPPGPDGPAPPHPAIPPAPARPPQAPPVRDAPPGRRVHQGRVPRASQGGQPGTPGTKLLSHPLAPEVIPSTHCPYFFPSSSLYSGVHC